MSGRRRRWLVAAAVGMGSLPLPVAWTTSAAAEPLGPGWEGTFVEPFGDGVTASGERLEVPVVFEYSGPPGSTISELTLDLIPRTGDCDRVSYEQPLDDGGQPTSPTTPTTEPGEPVTATWTFREDPGCNGVYDVSVTATATLPPVVGSEPTTTTSQPLVAEEVRVSLAAESPASVTADRAGDGVVTVRWEPPRSWAETPPVDALGYIVQRVGDDGAPVTIGNNLSLDERTVADDDLVQSPPGHYRYHVVALREGADGEVIRSKAGEAVLEIAPPPTTAPPATSGGGSSLGARPRARVGGVPPASSVQVPQPEVDLGFEEALDYGERELGEEQAVPPADAGLFDVTEEPVSGAGLLAPVAIGLCLAVWAGHLRHLARRASPPIS